jgi:hypothetical protein
MIMGSDCTRQLTGLVASEVGMVFHGRRRDYGVMWARNPRGRNGRKETSNIGQLIGLTRASRVYWYR